MLRTLWACALLAIIVVGCGRNPIAGRWEIDREENRRGVLLAVEAAELETLDFEADAIVSSATRIPVTYAVEGDVVRVKRGDGRGEHRVETLEGGRIRVELPIGVAAVYRRAGS